ncbi:microcystin-dependent protein [Caulobacter ginsengisoli]|uniref:Microcystin-dependent protein n=1 Tax=Caulobacter ginsengisoli TaxID=400775 RepID=A0ABU0ING5_9CAUL|nr:tail fiber protein [Caulobacter ginsengisoli]MDQ0463541.1 microcystin-dependent protein [Caulobacter ginsengisoli]
MSSPFVAEIRMFAGNFAPTGWAMCNGQLLPISQNTALFSLLGTYYGGDGKSTFALPDLQGGSPIGQGDGAGLSSRFLGEMSGSSNVTLIQSEIPLHSHSFNVSNNDADTTGNGATPTNQYLAKGAYDDGSNNGVIAYYSAANANPNVAMSPFASTIAGSSFPHNNMMPYLTVLFIIALQGVFPARP